MSLTLDQTSDHGSGCVDFLAYSTHTNWWIACGWIGLGWDDDHDRAKCLLTFDHGEQSAEARICLFPRADVKDFGYGYVLLVDAPRGGSELVRLALHGRSADFQLGISSGTERIGDTEAITRVSTELDRAPRSDHRARILKLLSRPAFTGRDTLDTLPAPVMLEVDMAYLCPPRGILLKGWFADPFRHVASIRLRSGARAETLNRDHWIEIARPDVVAALAPATGFTNERCGFLTFVPDLYVLGEVCYFEIETTQGEFGFRTVRTPRAACGADALKSILDEFDLRYRALELGYDHVIGPAVAALNLDRLSTPPEVTALSFGAQPETVRCSIVVPLYGRIDFMEYQLAFFARTLAPDHELIYVLDDPTVIRAAGTLAASCLARFRRSFKLLTYDVNLGYAPANNIGLRFARGEHVCFLNSDIFPKVADWLEYLLATAADPTIGVAGGLLLFEDESIQHEGMAFEHLAEFADWVFCRHPRKGLAPGETHGVVRVPAVTGACMVMRTDLARAVGGFDEGFVIGDFEDADLCLRLRARGLGCAVDPRAQLYHLERQSQGGYEGGWRQNLTLYNAWRLQKLHRPALLELAQRGRKA